VGARRRLLLAALGYGQALHKNDLVLRCPEDVGKKGTLELRWRRHLEEPEQRLLSYGNDAFKAVPPTVGPQATPDQKGGATAAWRSIRTGAQELRTSASPIRTSPPSPHNEKGFTLTLHGRHAKTATLNQYSGAWPFQSLRAGF